MHGLSTPRRILSLVLIAAVFVMDGYDLNAMALAVPYLGEDLGLEAASFGLVFSIVLIGLGLGAATLAPLGDKYGRRPLIVVSCFAIAAATLGTATASSILEFSLWRLATGAALGACLPNCTAISAELSTGKMRATVMSAVAAGIAVGAMAAGNSANYVTNIAGWEGLFIVPGVFAALLGVVLWFVLPDSKAAARTAQASVGAGTVQYGEQNAGSETSAIASKPSITARLPQLGLFQQPWRLPFMVFAGALTLNAVNLYLLTSWVPTILPDAGFTTAEAARVTGNMQGAGFVIGMVMSVLIDRWRPGVTMVGAFLFMATCFGAIGLTTPDPDRWTWLLLAGAGGVSGAGMALPALTAFLFPPHLLSSAVGMGVLVARVGAISGPLLGTAMLSAGVTPQMFLATAALPAFGAALICLAIPAALKVRKRVEETGA